ncbi:MAG: hypothetical protein ACYDHN_06095 [Solirubrobacteraceae bacterium]
MSKNRPSVAEFVEFAKRSEAVNLEVPAQNLIDAFGAVEGSIAASDGGWVLLTDHYLLICGAAELDDPALAAPVRAGGVES